MSYSRSSARSDLKVFTFPMASYNFRMRAICDVSDMRTFLRLMLMAHLRATPRQTGIRQEALIRVKQSKSRQILANAALNDAMASRDRECKGGTKSAVADHRQVLDVASR